MIEIFRTQIGLLDDHLGGLLRGKAYLVFGEGGTGKSLLGLQYALRGIDSGERALYLTMERPEDLIAQGLSLGLDLEPVVRNGQLVFLEYDHDVTSRILRYGWKPFLEQLEEVTSDVEIARMIFDPIHPLFAGTTEEGRLRYDLRYLVETLEEWGWTTLFLNDRGATQGHPSFYRVFSEICSGVFELQDEVENLQSSKYLFIHKLRQSSDRMRKIPFQIVPGQGLVESKPQAAPAPTVLSASSGKADLPKVLLADDDPFVRSLLKKGLRNDFEVVMAEDGMEALTKTLKERPDVVLLDVGLPKLTGFEVCRSLRACGFGRAILFVSALEDPDERVRGLTLGANDFISKPFQIREVIEKVRIASRFRLSIESSSFQSTDLETLLREAHSRAIPPKEFHERLAEACGNVNRFKAPLAIVRFKWDESEMPSELSERFRSEIEKWTRPEDLLSFLGENEAAVALNTEDSEGAIAYLRKLRRLWVKKLGLSNPMAVPAGLTVSIGVVEPGDGMVPSATRAFELAGREQRDLFDDPLFESESTHQSDPHQTPATGTDGHPAE